MFKMAIVRYLEFSKFHHFHTRPSAAPDFASSDKISHKSDNQVPSYGPQNDAFPPSWI